jgi:hypothetical protein
MCESNLQFAFRRLTLSIHAQARRSAQRHDPAAAGQMSRAEPAGEHLAVHARQLRVFTGYDDIVDHCCAASTKLTDQPWRIMPIGMRDWV